MLQILHPCRKFFDELQKKFAPNPKTKLGLFSKKTQLIVPLDAILTIFAEESGQNPEFYFLEV